MLYQTRGNVIAVKEARIAKFEILPHGLRVCNLEQKQQPLLFEQPQIPSNN